MNRCKSLKHGPRLSRFCWVGAESSSAISQGSDFTGEQSRLERMCSSVVAASRSVNVWLGLSVLPQGGRRRRNPPGFVSLNRWRSLHLISCLCFFPISSFYLFHVCEKRSSPYPLLNSPICRLFSMPFCVTVAAAQTGISKMCTFKPEGSDEEVVNQRKYPSAEAHLREHQMFCTSSSLS